MALITYFIRLKDHAGGTVANFAGRGRDSSRPGGLTWFSYRKRLRTPGAWSMAFRGDDDRIGLFNLDYQIEVWRRDPFISAGHILGLPLYMRDALIPNWYRDYAGLVRTLPQPELMSDGTYRWLIRGRGFNDWFKAEPIMYDEGSAQASKSAAAETVAKEFVNENLGPAAGVDSQGNSRVRPGLTIEADAATGAVWTGDRAYKMLNETLTEIGDLGTGDYEIVMTGPVTWEFQWRFPRWGHDHTVGNLIGNAAIEISARRGTAEFTRLIASYLDDVNVVNVVGQGQGDNAKVRARNFAANLGLSQWARRAVVVQSRGKVTDADMDNLADGELDESRAQKNVVAQILQTAALRYGPDPSGAQPFFDYGDKITTISDLDGTRTDLRIRGISVNVRFQGAGQQVEQITPEFEEPLL